jgi:hypothetical protein
MRNIYILSILITKLIISYGIKNSLDSDKMYIFLEEKEKTFEINLIENDITNELISILPLKTKLVEDTLKINNHKYNIPLREDIEVSNFILDQDKNEYIRVTKGDLVLYKKRELILFDENDYFLDENKEYIKIGKLNDVNEFLNFIQKDKKIFLWNALNYQNQKEKVKPNVYYTSILYYLTWKILTLFCFIFL